MEIMAIKTLKAVKRFQGEFGMKVDGIVGAKTKLKLWEATKELEAHCSQLEAEQTQVSHRISYFKIRSQLICYLQVTLGLSEQDINLMANAVYGESRGEPILVKLLWRLLF